MLRALKFILFSGNAASCARNLLLYAEMRLRRRDCAAVWDSCFDAKRYLAEHPELAASGIPAWLHFLLEGYRSGFNPSKSFHTAYYFYRHADVTRSGINPLLHYARHGWKERRPTAAAPGLRADGSRIPLPQRAEVAGGARDAGAGRAAGDGGDSLLQLRALCRGGRAIGRAADAGRGRDCCRRRRLHRRRDGGRCQAARRGMRGACAVLLSGSAFAARRQSQFRHPSGAKLADLLPGCRRPLAAGVSRSGVVRGPGRAL